ncbi:hypothetical protein J6590_071514 [Homalodisca vitripennis]|nr:hypothetical protein J6590_071514 [Homalodisca vitripennis]
MSQRDSVSQGVSVREHSYKVKCYVMSGLMSQRDSVSQGVSVREHSYRVKCYVMSGLMSQRDSVSQGVSVREHSYRVKCYVMSGLMSQRDSVSQDVVSENTEIIGPPRLNLFGGSTNGLMSRRDSVSQDVSVREHFHSYRVCEPERFSERGCQCDILKCYVMSGLMSRRDSVSQDGSVGEHSHSSDDSVIISRIRRSCEQKEEFLRRPAAPLWPHNGGPAGAPPPGIKEFYARPQKLQPPPHWPPALPQSPHHSPSRHEREDTTLRDGHPRGRVTYSNTRWLSVLCDFSELTKVQTLMTEDQGSADIWVVIAMLLARYYSIKQEQYNIAHNSVTTTVTIGERTSRSPLNSCNYLIILKAQSTFQQQAHVCANYSNLHVTQCMFPVIVMVLADSLNIAGFLVVNGASHFINGLIIRSGSLINVSRISQLVTGEFCHGNSTAHWAHKEKVENMCEKEVTTLQRRGGINGQIRKRFLGAYLLSPKDIRDQEPSNLIGFCKRFVCGGPVTNAPGDRRQRPGFVNTLGRIQETSPPINLPPPHLQVVSQRARQFESGNMPDRTSLYRSELARLSNKHMVPEVVVRAREYETKHERHRESRSLDSAAAIVGRILRRESKKEEKKQQKEQKPEKKDASTFVSKCQC